MGFKVIKEVKNGCGHTDLPNVNDYDYGTIVECDCGTVFLLTCTDRHDYYWAQQPKYDSVEAY